MSEVVSPAFKINYIKFPKLDFTFHREPDDANYSQSYRVGVELHTDRKILMLFGVALESVSRTGSEPSAKLISEAICEVELNQDLSNVDTLKDIPFAANILAQLLPFIREKVNYCFSNNQVMVILPPLNLHALVESLTQTTGLLVLDKRSEAKSGASASN